MVITKQMWADLNAKIDAMHGAVCKDNGNGNLKQLLKTCNGGISALRRDLTGQNYDWRKAESMRAVSNSVAARPSERGFSRDYCRNTLEALVCIKDAASKGYRHVTANHTNETQRDLAGLGYRVVRVSKATDGYEVSHLEVSW